MFCSAAGLAPNCRAERILSSVQGNNGVSETILLEPSEFSESSLVERTRQIRPTAEVRFKRVLFLSSAAQQFDFWSYSDRPFEVWAKRCTAVASTPSRVAEFILLGTNSVLRIRDGMTTRRIVVSGEDPLKLKLAGEEISMLTLQQTHGAEAYMVEAVSSKRPSQTLAEEVYSHLSRLLGTRTVLVNVGNLSFFPPDSAAACWWDSASPPGRDGFQDRTSVRCFPVASKVECIRYRGL